MEFTKYPSIENSYREKEIERIITNGFADNKIKWVVTEKVHGCCFSFISDGSNVVAAKRTSIIEDEMLPKFYDADIMMDRYKDKVLELTQHLKKLCKVSEVQIFGEHFGGIYDGKTEKGYTRVQREVQYIPFTDFAVFDILVTFKLGEPTKKFLDWDSVKELSERFGFKTVPELFRGTFEECLKYPNLFQTKVPAMYGLEDIEGNVTEGVVIKPIKNLRFANGERVILKNKNEKFKEKGKVKKTKIKTPINLTPEEEKIVDEISKYFEINRINALLSKGEVQLDWKQFGKISGLFFKDVLEDYIKDNPEFEKLDKGQRKLIQRFAQVRSNEFIRDFMKKHI